MGIGSTGTLVRSPELVVTELATQHCVPVDHGLVDLPPGPVRDRAQDRDILSDHQGSHRQEIRPGAEAAIGVDRIGRDHGRTQRGSGAPALRWQWAWPA